MRIRFVATAMLIPISAASLGAQQSAPVTARRDIVLTADCTRALTRSDGSADAIRICRDALEAVNQLPARATDERRKAHSHLGNAYALARRWPEAITEYESALRIDTQSDARDFEAGEYLGMIAKAYVNLGDLPAADQAAASAVTRVEASMAAHPDSHRVHADMLTALLQLHATIKQRRGEAASARALERKAATIAP